MLNDTANRDDLEVSDVCWQMINREMGPIVLFSFRFS